MPARPILKKYLKSKGISYQEFSKKLGISPGYLGMIIRGERNPSLQLAKKISKLSRIPLDKMIGGGKKKATRRGKRRRG